MFPKNNEENILLAKNVPSLDVSGDFYNFKNIGDKIYFTLGDVSGKGVDAGLIMARATALFEICVEEKKSLIEIVSLINDNLYNLRS
jgi:serine phosphatase RsbU (regulator of sigma subunit)